MSMLCSMVIYGISYRYVYANFLRIIRSLPFDADHERSSMSGSSADERSPADTIANSPMSETRTRSLMSPMSESLLLHL